MQDAQNLNTPKPTISKTHIILYAYSPLLRHFQCIIIGRASDDGDIGIVGYAGGGVVDMDIDEVGHIHALKGYFTGSIGRSSGKWGIGEGDGSIAEWSHGRIGDDGDVYSCVFCAEGIEHILTELGGILRKGEFGADVDGAHLFPDGIVLHDPVLRGDGSQALGIFL